MRPRVRRVDELVRHLRHAVLADHRLQQALRIGDVVEAEAALDAEPVLVGRAVLALDRDDLVVLDLIGELAADAAIRADASRRCGRACRDRRCCRRPCVDGISAPVGQACTHSPQATQVEAPIGSSKSNTIFSMMAAAGHADDVVDLHFAAGADAEIALDAGVEIDRHRRHGCGRAAAPMSSRLGKRPASSFWRLTIFQNSTVRIVRHLDGGLVGEQQFGDHLARGLGAVGLGLDLHAGRSACECSSRRARARPRSRPCRRGNCRPGGSRAAASSTGAAA